MAKDGQWVFREVKRPKPGPKTLQWLRAHGIVLTGEDSGGLARHERACQRALYWVLNGGGNGARNPRWSMQREWGPYTATGRMLAIRLSDPKSARLAVQRLPKSEQWWRNAGQQSGGIGSTKQRFPA
jgi:hypothetical protein